MGIETKTHLGVGGLTQVSIFLPNGQIDMVGHVCWARLVDNRWVADGESEPVFRAGVSLVEGQSLEAWDRLRGALFSLAKRRRPAARPQRRVVKWRPPRPY